MVREVVGFAPYERRVMELLKVGKDKRALKVSAAPPPSADLLVVHLPPSCTGFGRPPTECCFFLTISCHLDRCTLDAAIFNFLCWQHVRISTGHELLRFRGLASQPARKSRGACRAREHDSSCTSV